MLFGIQTLEQERRRRGRGFSCCEGGIRNGRNLKALSVRWKTSTGARIKGTRATPRRSPSSRSAAPTMGRTCRIEATKCFSAKGRSDWGSISTV